MPKFFALVLVALSALPGTALADWSMSAAAQARYDDNVGDAQSRDDKVRDETVGASLSAIQSWLLDDAYTVSAGGDLNGEWFDHLNGLRNVSIDGVVSLKRKWGLGAFAPWSRAALILGRSEFDDAYRDFTAYRATVTAGKRIDQRWNVWVEYAFEHRAAATGATVEPGFSADAFTQNGHRFAASMEYLANSRISLSLSTFARRGDVVSTVQSDDAVYHRARAIEQDPALGEDAYAFRVLGNTYGVRAGVGYALTEHSLLGWSYLRARTYANGADYSKSAAEINWNYKY